MENNGLHLHSIKSTVSTVDFLDFSVDEFESQGKDIGILCKTINNEGYELDTIKAQENTVDWINETLQRADLYEKIISKRQNLILTDEMKRLKDSTEENRKRLFKDLKDNEQKAIKGLNRLMIESVYPQEAPKSQLLEREKLIKLISQVISIKSYVVAYLDYKVLIGRYEDKAFCFSKKEDEAFKPKHIQKLRIFNETQEIFIWRSSEGLKGRLRIDETGDTTDVVDAHQVLFGTKAEPVDGNYTKITEKRGTELILPFVLSNIDAKRNRVFIKTRNYIDYIDYNEVNQATYVDCRFVGFWNNGKELT